MPRFLVVVTDGPLSDLKPLHLWAYGETLESVQGALVKAATNGHAEEILLLEVRDYELKTEIRLCEQNSPQPLVVPLSEVRSI